MITCDICGLNYLSIYNEVGKNLQKYFPRKTLSPFLFYREIFKVFKVKRNAKI